MIEFVIAPAVATAISCACTWTFAGWLNKRRRDHQTRIAEWEADMNGAYRRGFHDGRKEQP